MQVQFGGLTFTKTKFDGLDGMTTVSYQSLDNKYQGQATRNRVEFSLDVKCFDRDELAIMVGVFGELMDATWVEHRRLRPELSKNLAGH